MIHRTWPRCSLFLVQFALIVKRCCFPFPPFILSTPSIHQSQPAHNPPPQSRVTSHDSQTQLFRLTSVLTCGFSFMKRNCVHTYASLIPQIPFERDCTASMDVWVSDDNCIPGMNAPVVWFVWFGWGLEALTGCSRGGGGRRRGGVRPGQRAASVVSVGWVFSSHLPGASHSPPLSLLSL